MKTASCLDTMADGDQQMDKGREKKIKKNVINRENRRYKGRDKEVR
jgi:hypothetical protein